MIVILYIIGVWGCACHHALAEVREQATEEGFLLLPCESQESNVHQQVPFLTGYLAGP